MKLRKLDNKAKMSGAAAAVLITVIMVGSIFGGLYLYTGGNWSKLSIGGGGNGGGGNNVTPQGTYLIEAYGWDSLLTTTDEVTGTVVVVQYYKQVSGVWQQLGVATDDPLVGDSITLSGNEGGYIYAVVTTDATHYLDVAKTVQMNSILSYVGYENVLGGSVLPQYVFKINMNGITPGLRTSPDVNLNFYLIPYVAFTFAAGPTNATGVGTGLNTTYYAWYMIAGATDEGIAVRQITLSTNDTSSATQTLYRQNIPNVGFISGGTFTVNPQASAIVYTWNAPTDAMTGAIDLGSAVLWTYGTGGINKFDLTTALQTTLGAANVNEIWTLTVYWLTPAGAGASASQVMKISS